MTGYSCRPRCLIDSANSMMPLSSSSFRSYRFSFSGLGLRLATRLRTKRLRAWPPSADWPECWRPELCAVPVTGSALILAVPHAPAFEPFIDVAATVANEPADLDERQAVAPRATPDSERLLGHADKFGRLRFRQ